MTNNPPVVPQQGPQQDALTEQDWLTLDRIEQTLTTIGAITSDDAKWLMEHLVKLAKAARIDPQPCQCHENQRRQLEALGLLEEFAPSVDIADALGQALIAARSAEAICKCGSILVCPDIGCDRHTAAVVTSPSAPAPVARLYEAKRRVYQLAESIKSASLDAVAEEIDRGIAEVESAWRAVSSSSVADSPTWFDIDVVQPEDYRTVLVFLCNYAIATGFRGEKGHWLIDGWENAKPTHWMRLPKPPSASSASAEADQQKKKNTTS